MHAAIHQAALHPLTPGSPAYAIAKISAIGGLIGLRVALARRSRRKAEAEEAPVAAEEQRRPKPHPVSSRKAGRRSRKRR
jgi:hypothetical protein